MKRFQMISNNGGIFKEPTVGLSTVELPRVPGYDPGYSYESCVFGANVSEVVAVYDSLSDAIAGHTALAQQYKLN